MHRFILYLMISRGYEPLFQPTWTTAILFSLTFWGLKLLFYGFVRLSLRLHFYTLADTLLFLRKQSNYPVTSAEQHNTMANETGSTPVNATSNNTNSTHQDPDPDSQIIVIDQAHELPDIAPVKLQKISILEETTEKVDEWIDEVYYAVAPLGLRNLLDPQIPRPNVDDKSYKKWYFWSTPVAGWIFSHLHSGVKASVRPTSGRSGVRSEIFADTLMQEVTQVIQGDNFSNQFIIEVKRLSQLQQNSYGTIKKNTFLPTAISGQFSTLARWLHHLSLHLLLSWINWVKNPRKTL